MTTLDKMISELKDICDAQQAELFEERDRLRKDMEKVISMNIFNTELWESILTRAQQCYCLAVDIEDHANWYYHLGTVKKESEE